MTPIKAIRKYCIDCSGGSAHEVKLCPCTECSLYTFRLGKNPNIKPRDLTEEQRKAMGERLRKVRKE